MGEYSTIMARDGHEFQAWLAAAPGRPRGAVVVIQEIFGVNSHIRKVTDGFAVDGDRKSTRLNSSHDQISYAVFCLKKKKAYTQSAGAALCAICLPPPKYSPLSASPCSASVRCWRVLSRSACIRFSS